MPLDPGLLLQTHSLPHHEKGEASAPSPHSPLPQGNPCIGSRAFARASCTSELAQRLFVVGDPDPHSYSGADKGLR